MVFFFFSSRRRHTRWNCDWSSDVCSSDLLSGAPLRALATAVVGRLRRQLPASVAVIGVGGIASAADAREKLDAGANLVQLYTALVYRGPGLVGEIVRGLASQGQAR